MTARPSRPLALEGSCNFRELGGYEAVDGRRVRRGRLYRSGVMSYFTPADDAVLAELGVTTICDLRRAEERAREPTRWPTSVAIRHWDSEADQDPSDSDVFGNLDGTRARAFMLALYRSMPTTMTGRLHGVFTELLADDTPLVFHCSAGKDRTGLSAALVLFALGVPTEAIFEDYERSNTAVDLGAFIVERHAATMGVTDIEHPLLTMPPDARDALLAADPDYLRAALTRIEELHGTLDAYLGGPLGVDAAARDRLRATYLV